MILRQQMEETQATQATQATQSQMDPSKLSRNFSLEWLMTAMPMDSVELAATQPLVDNDTAATRTYKYACPRCEAQSMDTNSDTQQASSPRALSYIYRVWLVLRDATSELTPCLLEADSAEAFLAPVDPLKCFTSSVKAHQVYKLIQAGFNRKFLFTIDTFRMRPPVADSSTVSIESFEIASTRTVKILYKIVDMIEIVPHN